jgi:hypothetical protein
MEFSLLKKEKEKKKKERSTGRGWMMDAYDRLLF